MKKSVLLIASAFLAGSAFAQDMTNIGAEQLTGLSPVTGNFSLDSHEMGFASMVFNFKGGAEVDRTKDLYITVTRNGNVIANVPASNTAQVKYDNFYADVWQVSFFNTPSYESFAGGHYQVTIPEGYFLVGDAKTPNSEIVLNYLMKLSNISIYPAESTPMPELTEFVVTFGNSERVEINTSAAHSIEIYDHFGGVNFGDDDDPDQPIEDDNHFPFTTSIQGNSLKITLDSPITNPSTYDIAIPAGALTLYDENGVASDNKDMTFQYRIPKVGLGQPEIFPLVGLTLEFPGVIEISLQDGEKRGIVNTMGANKLYAVNQDGSLGEAIADYRATYEFYKDEAGNVIPENANKVYLKNVLGADVRICPAPGFYRLVTSSGLYQVNINGNNSFVDSFTYEYEVIDGNLFDMQFEPANNTTVPSLSEIKVKFPYADEIEVAWATAWLRSATTAYQFYPKGSVEDNTVVFTTSVPATMKGTYRFTSDLKSVTVDGDLVGICADYAIDPGNTGVQEVCNVVVLPAQFDICNAQGIVIKRNATLDDLNALPAGIYIAGGKKIVNRW